MKILVLYSSTDGHTVKICSYISKKLQQNHLVEMTKISNDDKINFSIYDFIIIGASIRYGTYRKIFLKFPFRVEWIIKLDQNPFTSFCLRFVILFPIDCSIVYLIRLTFVE